MFSRFFLPLAQHADNIVLLVVVQSMEDSKIFYGVFLPSIIDESGTWNLPILAQIDSKILCMVEVDDKNNHDSKILFPGL